MWFNELEETSYLLIVVLLSILALFALMVLMSLPCRCKYILPLGKCIGGINRRRRGSQVHDSNNSSRPNVIGRSSEDPTGVVLPQFPGFPFAMATNNNSDRNSTSSSANNRDEGRNRQVTFVTLTPGQLPGHLYQARVFKAPATIVDWGDEPPPTYESLFSPSSPPSPPQYSSSSIVMEEGNKINHI